MGLMMDKAAALENSKQRATWFLVGAAALFAASFFLRGVPVWVRELLRSMSEAAMVGGLADWFAVAALFRPVKLFGLVPVFPSHTAVIPKSRDRIAASLGDFVRDHFLATDTLVDMVKRHDPARIVADWFLDPRNAKRFGQHGARLLAWALDGLHGEKVQALMGTTLREALATVDLSRKAGELLETLTAEGRHHDLLDEAIKHLIGMLRDPATRMAIAERIAEHVRTEYPKVQLLLPTEALGRTVVGGVAEWIERYLDQVANQPGHDLREAFDKNVRLLIVHLKGDSAFAAKAEEIKAFILEDERFAGYIASLWTSLRDMLERDLRSADSQIHRKLVGAGDWIGKALDKDEGLRESLNRQAQSLVEQFGPNLGRFVSDHIEGTIKGWDAKAMSDLIEQNIGGDLQKIRINGTIIGGLLGAVLFVVTHFGARQG